jgi:hypothetical protein
MIVMVTQASKFRGKDLDLGTETARELERKVD